MCEVQLRRRRRRREGGREGAINGWLSGSDV